MTVSRNTSRMPSPFLASETSYRMPYKVAWEVVSTSTWDARPVISTVLLKVRKVAPFILQTSLLIFSISFVISYNSDWGASEPSTTWGVWPLLCIDRLSTSNFSILSSLYCCDWSLSLASTGKTWVPWWPPWWRCLETLLECLPHFWHQKPLIECHTR